MWTYAQSVAAYHAAPQRILDFWDVCYQMHTRFSTRDYWLNGEIFYGSINVVLEDIRPRSRLALFHRNEQLNDWLGKPTYHVNLFPGDPDFGMMPDAPSDGMTLYDIPLTSYWVASDETWWHYPWKPRRVRKSYWTGTPRRRRNL